MLKSGGRKVLNQLQVSAKKSFNRVKNPRTQQEMFARQVLMGLGICSVSIAASLIGLR